jgi:hypothetical protein
VNKSKTPLQFVRKYLVTLVAHVSGGSDVPLLIPRTAAECDRIELSAKRAGYRHIHRSPILVLTTASQEA